MRKLIVMLVWITVGTVCFAQGRGGGGSRGGRGESAPAGRSR